MNQTYRFIERKTMQSIRRHGLRPLTHTVLAALCFTLPACIEDVIVSPNDPYPPDVDGGSPALPVQPPDNSQSVYYDPLTFASSIQPDLDQASCAVSGCHDPRTAIRGFILLPAPSFGSFEMWSNLQFVTIGVDIAVSPFVAEDNSFFRRATDGHAGSAVSDPEALRAWLEDAAARYPDPQGRFDPDLFEGVIQPSLDSAGCGLSGCHDPQSQIRFHLYPNPAPGSYELETNLQTVIDLIDLGSPSVEDTVFYIRATDNHAGLTLTSPQAVALAAWIQAAMDPVTE